MLRGGTKEIPIFMKVGLFPPVSRSVLGIGGARTVWEFTHRLGRERIYVTSRSRGHTRSDGGSKLDLGAKRPGFSPSFKSQLHSLLTARLQQAPYLFLASFSQQKGWISKDTSNPDPPGGHEQARRPPPGPVLSLLDVGASADFSHESSPGQCHQLLIV